MPEFISIAMFVVAFLLTLAAARKTLMVTGYERFKKSDKDRRKTYLFFGFFGVVVLITAVLGVVFEKPVFACIVVAIVAAVCYMLASLACEQYEIRG